jgi:hypothetical protein
MNSWLAQYWARRNSAAGQRTGHQGSSIGTSMRASYPSAPDIWTVTFDRISGSSAYTATAYVVCANQVS